MSLTLLGAGNAGGIGYSPLTGLTGVIGWWDTKVTASLTLSGSNATAIADQSGLGNAITNGGTGNVITYSATGFNTSYPGMNSNGGTSFLESPVANFPMGTGNTLTSWYVGTMLTGSTTGFGRVMSYTHGGVGDNTNAGSWGVFASTTTETQFFRNNQFASKTGISASPAGHRCIYTINSSGLMTVYVDGVASATTATSTGNWISSGVLGLFRQAQHNQDCGYLTIAEAGIATGFANSTDVANLDTYLKNKWGL